MSNPLSKHFRQPVIYLKLPSGGKYYPDGSLEIGASGEIPIYSITIKDELMLKTPDALMNGESVSNMIRSCCPAIKDPGIIPAVDLDPLLIAIRIASYGSTMEVSSKCPHCQAENDHQVDLNHALSMVSVMKKYQEPRQIGSLVFEFRPRNFNELNQMGRTTFEQRKLIQVVTDSELPQEEKLARFTEGFKALATMNVETVASAIRSVTTDERVVVTDTSQIAEFIANADRKTYEEIKDTINDYVNANTMKSIDMPCVECEKLYPVNLEFNQSTFFE